MNSLILIDGPAACGKTTLANEIIKTVESRGCRGYYTHLTYIKDNREMWMAQYKALFEASVKLDQPRNVVVIDRHWMSENVYSAIYRGGTKLRDAARIWDQIIQRMCGIYVICSPEPESAFDRHAKMKRFREELYESDDRIRKIAHAFRNLYYGGLGEDDDYVGQLTNQGGMGNRGDTLLYDIDFMNMTDVVDEIIMRSLTKNRRCA